MRQGLHFRRSGGGSGRPRDRIYHRQYGNTAEAPQGQQVVVAGNDQVSLGREGTCQHLIVIRVVENGRWNRRRPDHAGQRPITCDEFSDR